MHTAARASAPASRHAGSPRLHRGQQHVRVGVLVGDAEFEAVGRELAADRRPVRAGLAQRQVGAGAGRRSAALRLVRGLGRIRLEALREVGVVLARADRAERRVERRAVPGDEFGDVWRSSGLLSRRICVVRSGAGSSAVLQARLTDRSVGSKGTVTAAAVDARGNEREVARSPAPGVQDRHTPESLLAVAVEVFNVRGYDGTSMEDLAKAAGITKSSIYHHVAGKEELLRLAVTRALDGLFGVLDEPGATEGARRGPASRTSSGVPASSSVDEPAAT